MSSQKRGGLSKREYKAKQAKKVTAPVRNTRPAIGSYDPTLAEEMRNPAAGSYDPSLADEMNPKGATQNPGLKGQAYKVNDSGPLAPGEARSSAIAKNKSGSSSNKKKSPSAQGVEFSQSQPSNNGVPGWFPSWLGAAGLGNSKGGRSYSGGDVAGSFASADHPINYSPDQRQANKSALAFLFGGTPTAFAGDDPLAREGFNRMPGTTDGLDPGLTQEQAPTAVDENADVWGPPQGPAQRPPVAGYGGGGSSVGMALGQSGAAAKPVTTDAEKYFRQLKEQSEDAFQQMLDSLSPTYKGYKDEFETELQKALMEERNALLGRQMAYGTADSEQRDQAEARISGEFADKRSSFLRRLVDQEASQRAQLGYDFASDQQDMGMKQWQMMQQQAQQQFENDLALLKQRKSGSGSGYSQEDINNWLDEQAQMSVDYDGNAPFARESIARRASKMFGGTPQNYINFFPDQWESGYTARPKITYRTDPMTGETVAYDSRGNPVQ